MLTKEQEELRIEMHTMHEAFMMADRILHFLCDRLGKMNAVTCDYRTGIYKDALEKFTTAQANFQASGGLDALFFASYKKNETWK